MIRKVAVVNRTNFINYGSVLQVYALCQAINSLGWESVVVWESGGLSRNLDIRPKKLVSSGMKLLFHPRLIRATLKMAQEVKSKPIDREKAEKFERFVEMNFNRRFYSPHELKKCSSSDEFTKFVCGSDQIWCSTTLFVDPMMYLRFAPQEKRIAYAPSIGRDYIPRYNEREMRGYINDIPYVSIRETKGQELVKQLTGRVVPVVLDPTLLLTREQWEKIVQPSNRKKFILLYFLDQPADLLLDRVADLATKEGLSIVSIGLHLEERPDIEITNVIAGPAEFLGLFDSADLIVTDSYHGMLFAINFEKRFWSVVRNYGQFDQSSRQKSILSTLGLESRYINDVSVLSMDEIPYNNVRKILEEERNYSLFFLRTALDS